MIFIDLDGTAAEWRVKASYEDLFKEGYFFTLKPHQEVIDAVRRLQETGTEVFILSVYLTDSVYALEEKKRWVDRYMPFIDAAHRLFVPSGTSKPDYVRQALGRNINKEFVLLDDFSENLHEWAAVGGTGIKLMNGYNGTKGTWKGSRVLRFQTSEKIATSILNVL